VSSRKKIQIRAICKENMANVFNLGNINKCRFWGKKYELPVSSIPKKENHKQPPK